MAMQMTVPELFERARRRRPNHPFLHLRDGSQRRSLSYDDIAAQLESWAGGLLSAGVRPGERVGLVSENRPEWVSAYLAILRLGAIVVPIDILLSPREMITILNIARVSGVIASRRFHAAIRSELTAASPPVTLLSLEPDGMDEEVPIPQDAGASLPMPSSTDVAVIIFTSGTTGLAKGVVLTHGNLCSDAAGTVASIPIRPDDNFLLLLPLYHTFSSTVNLLCAMTGGAQATFATSYKSRDILDDIRIGQVTMVVGVPQVFSNLMNGIRRNVAASPWHLRTLFSIFVNIARAGTHVGAPFGKLLFRSLRRKAGLNSVRLMISGGAALQPEINQFFAQLGFDLIQGYGLSEASPVVTVNLPHCNRIGSAGPAIAGIELRIDDPDPSGIGEICARGPIIMQGYFENPAATESVLRDGWLHTGDAGYIDSAGYLHITGRVKNVIVTAAGKNVYPEEIENTLNLSPFVLESLVLGIEKKRGGGEELVAFLVPNSAAVDSEREGGASVDVEAELKKVIDEYNSSAPSYRRIRQWHIRREEFEKTSTRKIKRFLYRNLLKT